MLSTGLVLFCVAIGVCATLVVIWLDENSVLIFKSLVGGGGKAELGAFQRSYLAVYLLAMMADWLQGPFVYALYDSYGFSKTDNASLFVAGFGSSFIFGTFIGALADKCGRRKFAALYCLLYLSSCLTKHVNSFAWLMVGRITGGVATSLLFSVFDAWLVSESNVRGFSSDQLSATFSLAMFGNSLVAIAAGEVGQMAADAMKLRQVSEGSAVYVGQYTAPFDLAIAFLVVCLALMSSTWPENYGESKDVGTSGHNFGGLIAGVMELTEEPLVRSCGIVCALFEASMFIFVFNWTPCVKTPGQPDPPFGHIFAGFMIMCMLGSRIFAYLTQTMSIETIGLWTLLVSAVCHVVPIIFGNVTLNFFAFLVFEMCVGLYFPMMGTLKGQIVREELRSTIYNLYRVPLNAIVVVTLVTDLDDSSSFTVTTCMLLVAFAVQFQLRKLRSDARGPAHVAAKLEYELDAVDATELGKLAESDSAHDNLEKADAPLERKVSGA